MHCSFEHLRDLLAPKGADILMKGIRERLFVPPLEQVGWHKGGRDLLGIQPAPRFQASDRKLDWRVWDANRILRTDRVLGGLWNMAIPFTKHRTGTVSDHLRVTFSGFGVVDEDNLPHISPGTPFQLCNERNSQLLVWTCDGRVLELKELKIEGDQKREASLAAKRARLLHPESSIIKNGTTYQAFARPLT